MQRLEATLYADVNVKAGCRHPEWVEQQLLQAGAVYHGEDWQVDTFYEVDRGKFKWRQGQIENMVTHYLREEVNGEWHTQVWLYETDPTPEQLRHLIGDRSMIGRVEKRRRIFFIDNVKFHIDFFDGARTFVEIEAMDREGLRTKKELSEQARDYCQLLQILPADTLTRSYIDLF